MYEKILIVASKKDKAGINITTQLSQFGDFRFYLVEDEIIHTESLDLEKINQFDFIIFPSKHKSEKGGKTLAVHAPGNWRSADYGGSPRKICKSSALFFKKMFETLNSNTEQYNLKDYKVTMEATHHGPLIEKPCLFVEIGSTENEWTNRKAGFIMARAISQTIKSFEKNPNHEVAIAIGGPHYCPSFNRIQLKSNVAISHIIPQYAMPITEDMIKEAIEKTEEEIDFALIDWKGLGISEKRQEILDILNKLYIDYKKTSEINK